MATDTAGRIDQWHELAQQLRVDSIRSTTEAGSRAAVLRSVMLAQTAIPISSRLVYVIDDDPGVRNSLKFSLEVEGFAVRDYSSANELLREPAIPDAGCLVIDYHLPEMNGLEMLNRMLELSQLK